MTIRRIALWLSGVLLGISGFAACTQPPPPPPVLIYGDSLTVLSEQAAQYLNPKLNIAWRAYFGTSLCDWLPQAAADRLNYHPRKIVLAFTGNTNGCAAKSYATGGAAGATAFYEKELRSFRVAYPTEQITIVIPPAMHPAVAGSYPFNGDPALVAMYEKVGPELGMQINTAADDWLTPGHVFAMTRPQFPYFTDPPVTVRTSDGVHVTSEGALWYGAALIRGL